MRHSTLFIVFSALSFLAIISHSSCNKDEGPFAPNTVSDTTEVSFQVHVQPIFDANCTACHTEQHSKLNLKSCCSYDQLLFTGFNAPYVDTSDAANSRIYKHLIGELSLMPPSGALSDQDKSLILLWIQHGAQNN